MFKSLYKIGALFSLTASLDILSGRHCLTGPLESELWTRGHLATAVSQATSKGRESVRALEKQMVAAHRRDLKETKGKKGAAICVNKQMDLFKTQHVIHFYLLRFWEPEGQGEGVQGEAGA